MQTEIISDAAMVLDDIASGTLSQEDFYMAIEQCGLLAVDLCKMIISGEFKEGSGEAAIIVRAAECMKDICICKDSYTYSSAMMMAKQNSINLYRVADQFA